MRSGIFSLLNHQKTNEPFLLKVTICCQSLDDAELLHLQKTNCITKRITFIHSALKQIKTCKMERFVYPQNIDKWIAK